MSLILEEHRHYLSDQARLAAFRRALTSVIKPRDVVVDLGAGTGILGLLACQAGAQRVYVIERSSLIELARQVAIDNRLADRMIFIKGLSTEVELPEKADVIVADQLGYFGFGAGLPEYFADAHRRFLKHGGVLIPSYVDFYLAPIEDAQTRAQIAFWHTAPVGFDFQSFQEIALNSPYPVKFEAEHLLVTPVFCGSQLLREENFSPLRLNTIIEIRRSGILHGIGGWFSAHLAPGITLSNAPHAPEPINRSGLFFPIQQPVRLAQGDHIHINLHILPVSHLVSWNVEVWEGENPGECKGRFRHTQWKSLFLAPEDLRRGNCSNKPEDRIPATER